MEKRSGTTNREVKTRARLLSIVHVMCLTCVFLPKRRHLVSILSCTRTRFS